MTATRMVAVIVVSLVALALAWWPWRESLRGGLARVAMAGRFVAILALLLLLIDPGIRDTIRRREPLVLLDNSISMHAAGGHADSAAALAASLGEVLPFGEAVPAEPGGPTSLGEPLAAAVSAGRPVIVVSDGEVADAAAIPPDLLAQASVRLLPRRGGPDVAITNVRLPARAAAGDSILVEIDVRASAGWSDSVRVEVRDAGQVLLGGSVGLTEGRAVLRLAGALPAALEGERWLEIALAGVDDSEPGNDTRLRRLIVTPSPGIVVIVARPDWDGRFLHGTLAAVAATPVRGYVQLQPGAWRRMDDLRAVTAAEVTAAARNADLLAVRGDTLPWRGLGRARLLWPPAAGTGDWYLSPAGLSPLSGALAGLDADSLPPLPAATAVPGGDWVALEAREARRGTAIPVVAGRLAGGRTVVIGVDGLHRWAFRGGDAEQAWRTMIAVTADWLLDTPPSAAAPVVPVEPVAQRGRPIRFRYVAEGAATPIAIAFERDGEATRTDTLRFDGDGIAGVVLPPGRYHYRLDGGPLVAERIAVEAYSDELHPAAVTLTAADAVVEPAPVRRSLRDLLPLFGLAVLGFGVEWVIRRRLGMR